MLKLSENIFSLIWLCLLRLPLSPPSLFFFPVMGVCSHQLAGLFISLLPNFLQLKQPGLAQTNCVDFCQSFTSEHWLNRMLIPQTKRQKLYEKLSKQLSVSKSVGAASEKRKYLQGKVLQVVTSGAIPGDTPGGRTSMVLVSEWGKITRFAQKQCGEDKSLVQGQIQRLWKF